MVRGEIPEKNDENEEDGVVVIWWRNAQSAPRHPTPNTKENLK